MGRPGRGRLRRWTSIRLFLGRAPVGRRRRSLRRRKGRPRWPCLTGDFVGVSVSDSVLAKRLSLIGVPELYYCSVCTLSYLQRNDYTFVFVMVISQPLKGGNNSRRSIKGSDLRRVPTTNSVSFVLTTCPHLPGTISHQFDPQVLLDWESRLRSVVPLLHAHRVLKVCDLVEY